MKITDLKIESVRRDYSRLTGEPAPPEVCGLPVKAVNDKPNPVDEEFPDEEDVFDEDTFTDATDLMETSMNLLHRLLDDKFIVMPHDIRTLIRNHGLDLYAFLAKWTDLEEREAQEQQFEASKKALASELEPILAGLDFSIGKDIPEGEK